MSEYLCFITPSEIGFYTKSSVENTKNTRGIGL
jgi:hypothetical protein